MEHKEYLKEENEVENTIIQYLINSYNSNYESNKTNSSNNDNNNKNSNNKQIFHAFLFNIRNYSPEVYIQRREAELNIILPRVNNFNIKQKKGMEHLCYYMPPTPKMIWEDRD